MRFLHPWNFPGRSTGVGCHFLLQRIFPTQGSNPGLPHCKQMLLPSEPPGKLINESRSVMSNSLWGLYTPWNSPGQSTGVGSLSLLQGIFPTQGSNPGFPHCRWILYQLSHQGSPRILEWVAYPFSSGSSWPRNRTGVSCTAGRFFANESIREAWLILTRYY